MNAIKQAHKLVERNPDNADVRVLTRLVLSLESGQPFELAALYGLEFDIFRLAIDILQEWRIDRHFARKAKLLDLSIQVSELRI